MSFSCLAAGTILAREWICFSSISILRPRGEMFCKGLFGEGAAALVTDGSLKLFHRSCDLNVAAGFGCVTAVTT